MGPKLMLARRKVKQALVKQGHKISHFSKSEIDRIAKELAKTNTWRQLMRL